MWSEKNRCWKIICSCSPDGFIMTNISTDKILLLLLLVGVCLACDRNPRLTQLTDERDGKVYDLVWIGDRAWMAENLNFSTQSGSWIYANNPIYADLYGRLYNWETAMEACPPGWRLPTHEEWEALVQNLGGKENAGEILKSEEHLSLTLGGFRLAQEAHSAAGHQGIYWSSTEHTNSFLNDHRAWMLSIFSTHDSVTQDLVDINYAFSVRCMQ